MTDYLSDINDDLTSITDIDLLKYQLEYHRNKLLSTIKILIQTELSYENVIQRIDYEQLLTKQKELNDEYNYLKDEYQHLGHACLYLINKTHDLIDERNKYYNEWQKNKSLLTPRPDWDKVSNVIDGGKERWKLLSNGKSSQQLVEILIKEIINDNQQEDFRPDGELPFLKTDNSNRIFNRHMRRRMTGLLIKEIWSDKIKKSRNSILADHVAEYFEKRFNTKSLAIEIGYNLRDACQRYHHSEQINLFWGIITGQIEELVYHHQMKSISQLLQHLIKMKKYFSHQQETILPNARRAIVSEPSSPLSMISNQRFPLSPMRGHQKTTDNVMTNEQFIESLKLFYPYKTSSQIDELYQSAKYDLEYFNEIIEFSLLFLEDDEGRFGEFLSTLIKQIKQEKISYVEQIKEILLGYPLITVSQFSRAVYMIDPNINQNELHRYIEWVFLIKNYHPSQQLKPIDLEDLLRRLENCACFKH